MAQEPARLSRRMTTILHNAGYQINATVPDDHRAFYRFQKNHKGEVVKSSMVKLGTMRRDLYYHIIRNAPDARFAVKELLANFGIDFNVGGVSRSEMAGVELSPGHVSDLRADGVDVNRLGQGQGVPMNPMEDIDDTPSTPGLADVMGQRTEAVARMGSVPPMGLQPAQLIVPPTIEPTPPPTEPPPPTAPTPSRDQPIPEGEVKHAGTITRDEMLARTRQTSFEPPD